MKALMQRKGCYRAQMRCKIKYKTVWSRLYVVQTFHGVEDFENTASCSHIVVEIGTCIQGLENSF